MTRLKAFQRLVLQYADVAERAGDLHRGGASLRRLGQLLTRRIRSASTGSLEERLRAARLMAREAPGVAIVADSMENSCNSAYGAYFDRLYIVQDGKVVYQGGRGPEGSRISELRHWLDQYRKRLRDAVIRVVK